MILLLPLPRSPSSCKVTHSSPTNPAFPFSAQTNPRRLKLWCHARVYPRLLADFFQVLWQLPGHCQQLGTQVNCSASWVSPPHCEPGLGEQLPVHYPYCSAPSSVRVHNLHFSDDKYANNFPQFPRTWRLGTVICSCEPSVGDALEL